ncbi:MAG: MFS transporter [Opitutales bacterium]|nr:MFS transporter [Opitutales bacterium]
MARGTKEQFKKILGGRLFETPLPKPSPASKERRPARLAELLPDNFSFFPEIARSLRSKNFFIFFCGQIFSLAGIWIQQIAMSWLVLDLSPEDSYFYFSCVVFLANIPTLFITPVSGAACDVFSRKKILLCTQTAMMLLTFALAFLTLSGLITIPAIMALSFLLGVAVSFDAPARQSFYCELVPMENLGNAIALNSIAFNGTRLVGPAIGGVLIGIVGEGWCFFINAAAFLAVIGALLLIKTGGRPAPEASKTNPALKIWEGLAYTVKSVPLRSILALLTAFSFFGAPFAMVFPAFVRDALNLGTFELGALMSCIGLGALAAAIYLAARKSVLGLGKVAMLSCILFGAAEIAMSLASSACAAAIICVPMGFCLISVAASCNTLLQTIVDDEKRGRIMSLFTMAIFGVPPLGAFLFGVCSDIFGIRAVMAVCACCCVITGLIFLRQRPIVRKHTRAIYIKKGIISEIAAGLNSASKRP